MDEHDGFAAVEFFPDWLDVGMTQVGVTSSIPREQTYTVGAESVEGVGYFLESGFGVEDVAERDEESEALRIAITYGCRLVV